jgi:hypothetical protein
LSIVTPYLQETLSVVTEQTTLQSRSNGSFLVRCDEVNTKPPWQLEICRVIYEISQYVIIDILKLCHPNGLIRINPYLDHTFLVGANRT